MIISYKQNLYFKIHYKKFQKQDYISFHHTLILKQFTQKYEHKIHCKSIYFSVLL
jgi:hypothetical protein